MTPDQLIAASTARSGRRVVSAACATAAAAGLGAYSTGGNAFDAALAACFMETITLPMKCGLAGDLVALFRVGGGPLQTLVSVGPGCAALADGARLERLGPRSVGIPGAPDGYATLAKHARLDLNSLVRPAVHAAREGVVWTPTALSYLVESIDLLQRYNQTTPYTDGAHLPRAGDLRQLPGLGALLERFAHYGADLFAHADGERLARAVQARGGFIRAEDLCGRHARMAFPVACELSIGTRILTTPAPTGGPRLLDIMRSACVPGSDLLDIIRAERSRAKARDLQPTADGTSVVTAADEDGNAIVVVHSNSFPRFGSGVVLEDGLVLSNRPGRGFDLSAPPESSNAPKAGRVPRTTLHAWALERDGKMFLGATPGGVNQLPWNAQSLVGLLRGDPIDQIVCDPRWALDEADKLSLESGASTRAETGPQDVTARFLQRSAQQILELPASGLLRAAADPRAGAVALGAY